MPLKRLINPDGDEVLTSIPTREADAKEILDSFAELGYTQPKETKKSKKASTPEPPAGGADEALKKMKLTELLEHAASVGVDEETIAELSKPGTSKAQVIEAITAAAAAS